jgi:hypothetical protein
LEGWNMDVRGQLMWNAVGHSWSTFPSLGSTEEEVKKVVLTGKMSVMWDDNGDFILGNGKPWDVPPN